MLPWFFLSGAVALGCEVVWFRALAVVLGASLPATGTLLAVFMAGLSAGAALGGWLSERTKHPVRAYALAEALVALSAGASPWVLGRLETAGQWAQGPSRAALCALVLALPTVSMGATLPLLTSALGGPLQRAVGALLATNLAGAVTGTLVTGFALLPWLGMRASLTLWAFGALGTALGAWVTSPPGPLSLAGEGVAEGGAHQATPSASPSPARERGPGGEVPALVALGALGTASFALQVCHARSLALLLGSSAYTFALVGAAVLAGNGLGGLWSARSAPPAPWAPWASRWFFALAVLVWLGSLGVHASPVFLAWAAVRGHGLVITLALLLGVALPPAVLVGRLYPVLVARAGAPGGRSVGLAVAAGTAGNVLGALGAAFVAIPRWGVQGTLLAVALGALAVASACAALGGMTRFRATLAASALAVLGARTLGPEWDVASLSAGSFRAALYRERFHARGQGCDPSRRFTDRRVLFARDGALGTVVVLGLPGGPSCSLYSLRINGKAEGSVFVAEPLGARLSPASAVLPVGDLPTEVLAGWLPGASGPRAERAFLVGWGTGLSTRALLSTEPLSVRAVELEPAVYEAARVFDGDALNDPRVERLVDDARTVLRREPQGSLDVVASHPSNPWVSGASALFSREYFQLARSRLREGGRMLAWVQLYETDREAVRTLVATFLESFPEAHAFRPSRRSRDLLLLGFRGAPRALRARFPEALPEASLRGLRRAGVASLEEALALRVAGPGALSAWSRGARVSTDDNGALEYRMADHLRRAEEITPEAVLQGLASLQGTTESPPAR